MPIFELVSTRLMSQGIELVPDTLQKYAYQGFMSTAYIVDSSIGKLLIKNGPLVEEHIRNGVWHKFAGLSDILTHHTDIPTSRFIFSDFIDGQFIFVQTWLPGERAGQRELHGVDIVDVWNSAKEEVVSKILQALARVHSVTLPSFGWQAIHNNAHTVQYFSWQQFLEQESRIWIDTLVLRDSFSKHELQEVVRVALEKKSYTDNAVLVHGDAINPSNILVHRDGISLLDWEWAIAADPAWEFCDIGWEPFRSQQGLAAYFSARNIQTEVQADFIDRIKRYARVWLLWGMYMHAKDKDAQIYDALRKRFLTLSTESGT